MRVLVVSSTQPKYPAGSAPWIRATLGAIEHYRHHEFVASVGTSPWELALWKAVNIGARIHLICPLPHGHHAAEIQAEIATDFHLQSSLTSWHMVPSQRRTGRLKDAWLTRDATAFELAELVCPISVRAGGRIEAHLRQAALDDQFRVDHVGVATGRRFSPGGLPSIQGQWLLHLTRSSQGPWPGETKADYFRSIVESTDTYPREGFCTLARMVSEKRIRSSSFRIRGDQPCVSFTELGPNKALSLVRWRARYARYSFEPYAVGIRLQAAQSLGARPVVYDLGSRGSTASKSVWHQGRGQDGNWETEQEWRIAGDMRLDAFDRSDVLILTATAAEAAILRNQCVWRVEVFG